LCSFKFKLLGGDGRKGYEPGKPYDAIHVGAAATELPPAVRAKKCRPEDHFTDMGAILKSTVLKMVSWDA